MGRPKAYTRDEVLHRAMELFWLNGFDATSTSDLAAIMGINRNTMYTEFGSKQGLFLAALDRYVANVVPTFIGEILAPDGGLAAIAAVLNRFKDAAGSPGTERGCMACNVAAERAGTDPETRERVERYVAVLEGAFTGCLRNAVHRGELVADLDVEAWARTLVTTMMGIFLLIRAQLDGSVARSAAALTLEELRAHRPA